MLINTLLQYNSIQYNTIYKYRCVGVWDTVGSVYNTIDALNIKDTSLPPTIDIALHALALQENRGKYLPSLWTLPETNKVKRGNTTQVLKEACSHPKIQSLNVPNASYVNRSGSLERTPMLAVDMIDTN